MEILFIVTGYFLVVVKCVVAFRPITFGIVQLVQSLQFLHVYDLLLKEARRLVNKCKTVVVTL